MTLGRISLNIIVIVIVLDILPNNFDLTSTSLLKVGDKSIDQIRSILQLRETKNISKRFIRVVTNTAISFKNN